MFQNQHKGFSLVEVVIVLAISSLMMVIVGGFYAQRRSVASDDAMQQMTSKIQTVQNETASGKGPTSDGTLVSGETLYGEAIEFSNTGCNSADQSCIKVYKLKTSSDGNTFSVYEQSTLDNSQGLFYYVGPTVDPGCTDSGYQSCFNNNVSLNKTVDFQTHWVVIKNGSGKMFYMDTRPTSSGGCATGVSSVPVNQRLYNVSCGNNVNKVGRLQQAVTDSNSGTAGNMKYFINIDMLNGNSITSNKYTGEATPAPTPGFK